MNLHITIEPILAIVIGILILLKPSLFEYLVAIYLLVIGVIGLSRGL